MSNLELPEVFNQTQPKEDVSERYQMINTGEVISKVIFQIAVSSNYMEQTCSLQL